jgi:hypothetical protein
MNIRWIVGSRVCGLADDVEVLPDGEVLGTSNEGGGEIAGFTPRAAIYPAPRHLTLRDGPRQPSCGAAAGPKWMAPRP